MRCDCYKTRIATRYAYDCATGYPIKYEIKQGYCSGTRELDSCDCKGLMENCSFYEEVRERAKTKQIVEYDKNVINNIISWIKKCDDMEAIALIQEAINKRFNEEDDTI